jgi:hypothetical protein
VELEEAGGGGESLLYKFQFWSPVELNRFNTCRKGVEVGRCTVAKRPIGSGQWRRCLIDA